MLAQFPCFLLNLCDLSFPASEVFHFVFHLLVVWVSFHFFGHRGVFVSCMPTVSTGMLFHFGNLEHCIIFGMFWIIALKFIVEWDIFKDQMVANEE